MKKRITNKEKITTAQKITLWAVFAIFFVYAFTLVWPFIWMFLNAGKTQMEFFRDKLSFPAAYKWSNFSDALFGVYVTAGSGTGAHKVKLLEMFWNSIYLTVILTVLEVFVSTCAAYVITYYRFPGRKLIYGIVVFTMVVPLVGTLPVCYDFFARAHLLNTIPGMILLCVNGLGFAFLILYGGFQNLSCSYAEAASLDGAGPFRTFFSVMLPLMRPAIVSIAVVTAISFWNDYTTPAVYYADHPTLAYGINTLLNEVKRSSSGDFGSNYPLMFACILVAVTPIIIFFACFQKTIMKNMSVGGLKG